MKPHGTYKLGYRLRGSPRREPFEAPLPCAARGSGAVDGLLERIAQSEQRVQRILDSLREEIVDGEPTPHLRIRQVFCSPREIYRLELARPDLGYLRTTFLDRDALEELLETDAVRKVVETGLERGAAL